MKHVTLTALLCVGLAFPASAAPPAYDLQRTQAKTPPAFAWTVQAMPGNPQGAPAAPHGVFRTLSAPRLQTWVAHLPSRSVIRFLMVAMPETHPDPSLRPNTTFWAQLKDFGAFCKAHRVLFQPEMHAF